MCIQISIYRHMHTFLLAYTQNISEKIKAENTGGLWREKNAMAKSEISVSPSSLAVLLEFCIMYMLPLQKFKFKGKIKGGEKTRRGYQQNFRHQKIGVTSSQKLPRPTESAFRQHSVKLEVTQNLIVWYLVMIT